MNGAGNGTPGQKSGYHIGQICRTSARHARCSSTAAVVLPVRETVNATELDSDVAVCANAKEVEHIMTKKAELIMAMMCAEFYGADIKLYLLITSLDVWYKYIFNNKSKTLLPQTYVYNQA